MSSLQHISAAMGTDMDNEILATIIAVEHEIRERLAAEEQRAAQMLNELRQELEQEARQEEERLEAAKQKAIEKARREAELRAEAVLQDARAKAQQLEELPESALKGCIARYLGRILPERDQ